MSFAFTSADSLNRDDSVLRLVSAPGTVSYWAKADTGVLVGPWDGFAERPWLLSGSAGVTLDLSMNNAANISGGTIPSGWSSLTARWSASGNALFIDGTSVATGASTLPSQNAGSFSFFTFGNCKISDVGVWNVALTDSEIVALAKGVHPSMVRKVSQLGVWPLWGGASGLDMSPNVRALTVSGSPTFTSEHPPTGSPYPSFL